MKVVICWSHVSGYMAACWRALAAKPEIELHVIAFAPEGNAAFAPAVVSGLHCELVNHNQRDDADFIAARVIEAKPDVVMIPGWLHRPYSALAREKELANARFVMGIDTSYTGSIRQRLGRVKVGRLIDRMDLVVVAGERAFQLARALRVAEAKILRGVYGYDDVPLAEVSRQRESPLPRKFLYVGRYVPEKGLDVLFGAYEKYRSTVSDPWALNCAGKGPIPMSGGAVDLGFVQPAELPALLLEHGVGILVSRFEPWGVALAEAMASGMPVIASEACGGSVELVRHLHNGLIVPTGDVDATADAMRWVHEHAGVLPEMGKRARGFALAYSAEAWAERMFARIR